MTDEFCLKMPDFHVTFRDLLHAVNLRYGTNGFTSLPKEGVLRIFSPWKIWRHRPGLNPRTWVPKASTLPVDHRSRFTCVYILISRLMFIASQHQSFCRDTFRRDTFRHDTSSQEKWCWLVTLFFFVQFHNHRQWRSCFFRRPGPVFTTATSNRII